jgi:translation initiation factor IF-2
MSSSNLNTLLKQQIKDAVATIYDEQGKTHENRYSNPEQLSKALLDLLFPAETAHNTEVTGVVRVPTVHDEAKPVTSDSESTDSKKERKKRAPMSDEAKAAMKAKREATIAAKKAAPAPAEAAPAPAPAPAPASDGEEKDKKARKPRGPMSDEAKAAMKAKREATIAAKKAAV